MSFTWWRYPTRRFNVDGINFSVVSRAKGDGLHSTLLMLGVEQASDRTPVFGSDAVRNHLLNATLPDGRTVEVEFGYIGIWTTGIVARLDGRTIYESHKGQVPAYPEKYREAATENDSLSASMKMAQGTTGAPMNGGVLAKENRLPFAVDVVTGLLFYLIAKMTDLQTAAMVGVVVGFGLVLFQRITKIDVTGGLALFGIAMLCISAALALWLNAARDDHGAYCGEHFPNRWSARWSLYRQRARTLYALFGLEPWALCDCNGEYWGYHGRVELCCGQAPDNRQLALLHDLC
jgi:type III secretory pathway component EscS